MADHAFLVGRPDSTPTFWSSDSDEDIAYAKGWIPIGWLALFESRDVVLMREPVEKAQTPSFIALKDDDREPATCATLIRSRELALDIFKSRLARLEKILPAALAPQLGGLKAAVENARSPYIQAVVTDLDVYISYGESEKLLRQSIVAIDSDDPKHWRTMLSFVQATLGTRLTNIQFPRGVEAAALVGYLPERFSIPYNSTDPKRKSTRPWWRLW